MSATQHTITHMILSTTQQNVTHYPANNTGQYNMPSPHT